MLHGSWRRGPWVAASSSFFFGEGVVFVQAYAQRVIIGRSARSLVLYSLLGRRLRKAGLEDVCLRHRGPTTIANKTRLDGLED